MDDPSGYRKSDPSSAHAQPSDSKESIGFDDPLVRRLLEDLQLEAKSPVCKVVMSSGSSHVPVILQCNDCICLHCAKQLHDASGQQVVCPLCKVVSRAPPETLPANDHLSKLADVLYSDPDRSYSHGLGRYMQSVIHEAVRHGLNLLVIGTEGSGKSSLVSALSGRNAGFETGLWPATTTWRSYSPIHSPHVKWWDTPGVRAWNAESVSDICGEIERRRINREIFDVIIVTIRPQQRGRQGLILLLNRLYDLGYTFFVVTTDYYSLDQEEREQWEESCHQVLSAFGWRRRHSRFLERYERHGRFVFSARVNSSPRVVETPLGSQTFPVAGVDELLFQILGRLPIYKGIILSDGFVRTSAADLLPQLAEAASRAIPTVARAGAIWVFLNMLGSLLRPWA